MVTERQHHWRCFLPYWREIRPLCRKPLRSRRVRANFLAIRYRERALYRWRGLP